MKHKRSTQWLAIALFAFGFTNFPANAGDILDGVRERGQMRCATMAARDIGISGLDQDFCRAISAAVLGDVRGASFFTVSAKRRFEAMQQKAADVLINSVTWTLGRDAGLGMDYAGIIFYDGQGFLAHKKLNATRLADVKKATVCVESGTTTVQNIGDYAKQHAIALEPIVFDSYEQAQLMFFSGRCDMYSSDRSHLISLQYSVAPKPEEYILLSDTISKEPLSIVVNEGDAEWLDIVKWVLNATLQAEEMGITSENAVEKRANGTLQERFFLGAEPGVGEALGLDDGWVFRVITQVGNYSEIFERRLGAKTPFNMSRGLNALWTDGGLMYSPPFR